ncbi:uncharacterized protein LOC121730376 [Aricia agestis]|uniref:uncharacterized protein LOC121730376 n=1 Tax=Aricia agestis TaxID=91739 RepID=UPI001C201984|nr:uncharacterized protein LOC121730376 [Aricia agestis]
MPQSSKRSKACNGQTNGHHSNSSYNGINGKVKNNNSHKMSSIPKDVQNDLDKALVTLCDVWFDEMKPYLVRNNVKVHVTREHEKQTPRPVECSHCDPASSASSCSLCALLLGAANNIDSAVRQATSNHSPHHFAA